MEDFSISASDGHKVACYAWVPREFKAIVQLAHGMGEHARRYDWAAQELNSKGYAVYANDLRGHGETSGPTLGYMGADGWNRSLADIYELGQFLKVKHAGLKHILLGHSMGALLAQQYVTRYGRSIDVLVLSASPGFRKVQLEFIGRLLMKLEIWRHGPDGISRILQKVIFGNSNSSFDFSGSSGYEWLSRDQDVVAGYVADRQCGFVLTPKSLLDMFDGVAISQDKNSIMQIPEELPVYIFSGSEDPVHAGQANLDRLLKKYRERGLSEITCKFYPGGRHEMFNEKNKEVVAELVRWLDQNL